MKYHQYLFSFLAPDGGASSVTLGLEAQQVTQDDISQARAAARAPNDIPLMAVSYLGYMTMKEFRGQ